MGFNSSDKLQGQDPLTGRRWGSLQKSSRENAFAWQSDITAHILVCRERDWSVCVVLGLEGEETVWWRILWQRKESLLQDSGDVKGDAAFVFEKQEAYTSRVLSSENVNRRACTLLTSLHCCTVAFRAANAFSSNVTYYKNVSTFSIKNHD